MRFYCFFYFHSMANNTLLYQIALTLVPGIGDVLARKLIGHCGSAEAVFSEKKKLLLKIPGIGEVIANAINDSHCFERAIDEISFIESRNIRPLFYMDNDYPQRLKDCHDAPVILYYKGIADLNSAKILAVVGTRKPTDYGKEICDRIVSEMNDVLIVSGLAYGVDTCAHQAALKSKLKTIGVLAHGLDRIYPAQNEKLASEMVREGGVLTDFMSRTRPEKENFPQRNRIVAGMADATLVVETASRGGSLITASLANGYNRDVFAVPGKVTDSKSAGCNWLIRSNRATLVENATQIKEIMGWNSSQIKGKAFQKTLFPILTADEEVIYKILEANGECSIDFIIRNSDMTSAKVSAALLNMEFEDLVKILPGRIYTLAS